ncbi:hypothetical protein HBI23_112200 [Parastagonospora nodorum]|nr:hypothetical protein HBH42_135120 [Parastagonospora nodorum]KAH5661620.1 hypothetical protein HBI23_112200 [Parastagonospora nodorum]
MSSNEDDERRSPPRRRSSTPDTPRKRRRLGSLKLDAAGLRKHDLLRRRTVEANYNDEYRELFNEQVTHAASRFHTDESVRYYTKQVGTSTWSPSEQAVFFAALERLGKDDLPGIARAIGTKAETEARDFLLVLQDAAAKHVDAKVTLRDIPAAIELGDACSQTLEEAADALAWYQERFDAEQEQERYGEYWLITPSIAEEIEDAINGSVPSRPASVSGEREPSRYRKGVAGACASCKKSKRKCDRQVPCAQCVKAGTNCVYPKDPPSLVKPDSALERMHESTVGTDVPPAYTSEAPILRAIPEARLLQPEVMLTLSREVFMNRSDDIPSPWPHWSHYISEVATEPSIYRTALNDFHRLVLSVTKRLVQTAIIQATSRMRSQRSRKEKGSYPLIKSRDVYTAIDVLGMKRNGSERWQGVPRRCGLKVTASKLTTQGRRTREVPWGEVESIMGPVSSSSEYVDTSGGPNKFKSRAARSGTPLPMHNLTLSDSDDEVIDVDMVDDDDSDSSEHFTDVEARPPAQRVLQPRDPTGRYATLPPETQADEIPHQVKTLEEFDQEATWHEERVLWDMLGVNSAANDEKAKTGDKVDEVQDPSVGVDEKVATTSCDWRQLMEYRAPWEKYETTMLEAQLLANQKRSNPKLGRSGSRAQSTGSLSGDFSDGSSTTRSRRAGLKSTTEINLHVRGTNAYAALQGVEHTSSDRNNSDSDPKSATPDEDVPTQSIEAGQGEADGYDSESDMDWS